MLGKGVSSARTDVIAAPAISKPNNIDPQRFLMMTPGADDRHGARGSRSDRRGNLPDDRRHGEVAGFAVLAAYSLVDDGCGGSGGSDLLRRPGGEASGGRWGVCLLEGGLRALGGLPLRLAIDAGHRSWHHGRHRGWSGALRE